MTLYKVKQKICYMNWNKNYVANFHDIFRYLGPKQDLSEVPRVLWCGLAWNAFTHQLKIGSDWERPVKGDHLTSLIGSSRPIASHPNGRDGFIRPSLLDEMTPSFLPTLPLL